MKKVALAAIVACLVGPGALAQSFNGGGRMNAASPTGWGPNPNAYAGVNGGNPYGNTIYPRYPGATGATSYGGVGYPFCSPTVNPVAAGNGFFNFTGGGVNANLWLGPSGYYYPWAGRNPAFTQIVYIDQSGSRPQTVVQQPPLSMEFSDMGRYLDDAHKQGNLEDNDWQSLKQRLKDIHSKERSYRIAGDGILGDGQEAEIRQDLNDFAKVMTNRVKI